MVSASVQLRWNIEQNSSCCSRVSNSNDLPLINDLFRWISLNLFFFLNQTGYQHDKVNHWTKTVVDNCLGVLTKLQKPYKYIGKYGTNYGMWNSFEFRFVILFFSCSLHCMYAQWLVWSCKRMVLVYIQPALVIGTTKRMVHAQ